MQTQRIASMLLIAGCALPLWASDQRHHDAHEHGIGQLNFAQDGNEVHIEFNSPAANIVGYEHMPETDKDRATLETALTRLRNGKLIFSLPEAASCSLSHIGIETPLMEHEEDEHAHHHEHEDRHEDEIHANISATWRYDCKHPAALDQVEIRLFEAFPDTEQLQVQFITERRQGAATLNAAQPVLRF